MRAGVVVLVVAVVVGVFAGCFGGKGKGGGVDGGSDAVPLIPENCELICTPEHNGCGGTPPSETSGPCREVCYWGGCCVLTEQNTWVRHIYDCWWPHDPEEEPDAGIDAEPATDGGLDAEPAIDAP